MTALPSRGFSRSRSMLEEAANYSPGGVHSNVRLGMTPFPLFFERAKGSRLWDVDGNEYIDYALGMGPVILGHAAAEVNEAIGRCLAEGQLYAGQHEDELQLARAVCQSVPCAEMVRFSLSGSEAVQAALRLARAATGRHKIIKFEGHYHGWFDNVDVSVHPREKLMGPAKRPHAAPESLGQSADAYSSIIPLPWNDLEVLTRRVDEEKDSIAAVIMEPIMCNTSVILPKPGFLEGVRELCSRNGIILIFDEVITGFRVGLGGGAELLRVQPDLVIFAKAMGNGFPISCLAGERALMGRFAGGVEHAGTYNANRLSCAASLATVQTLRSNEKSAYASLANAGSALIDGIRKIAAETGVPLLVQGLPMVFHTTFTTQKDIMDYRGYQRCDLDLQKEFVTRLRERGINLTGRGVWFLSAAHTASDVAETLEIVREVLLLPAMHRADAYETARALT